MINTFTKRVSQMNEGRELVVGIDLGTTYSCVGTWDWESDKVRILATEQGERTIPSVVCFHKGKVLVGESAKAKLTSHPQNTIYNSKRAIGRPYSRIRAEDVSKWTFQMEGTDDDRPRYRVQVDDEERLITPEEISALILANLKKVAEKALGHEVTKAVVTVPAYFTEPQRRATRDAGLLAGLDIIRLLPEPTAAALAFGLDRTSKEKNYVLVFDMGGGTFDVSVLRLDGNQFTALAVTGDFHLGGEDFDDTLLEWVMQHPDVSSVLETTPVTNKLRQKLRRACEEVKRELSSCEESLISVEIGGNDIEISIKRSEFEEMCSSLFDNAMMEVSEALELADIEKSAIDSIVLVGGSTRIPKLQQRLCEFFDGKKLWCGVNPDEAVAWGATALATASVMGSKQSMGTIAPSHEINNTHSGNNRVGRIQTSSALQNLHLTSVTPITLGIELSNGKMDVLIPKGTQIPAVTTEEYTTGRTGQKSVVIRIYEGEDTSKASSNYFLGKFPLPVVAAEKGKPRVRVKFQITVDGIILVTATINDTGKEVTMKLEGSNLTADEKNDIVASIGTERAHFKSFVSQVYGAHQDKPNLVTACVEELTWIDSYPDATKTEVAVRKSAFQAVMMAEGASQI